MDQITVEETAVVDPIDVTQQGRVTIRSELPVSPSLRGVVEKLFTPRILRRIYRRQLQQLNQVAQQRSAKQGTHV